MVRNNVKEKLKRGEVVASMTVRLVRGIEIARIAKTAGFDSIYVDDQHSSFSLDTTGQICMAAMDFWAGAVRAGAGQHAGIHFARARRRRARAWWRRMSARLRMRGQWWRRRNTPDR